MPANSETFNFVISSTNNASFTHPGDSTSVTNNSDKLKGDGYYGRSDGLHSVQYNLDGFSGTILIQGTLATDPAETDWFTVDTNTLSTETTSAIRNVTGNYVWIRIVVTYTDGTVNGVVLNH